MISDIIITKALYVRPYFIELLKSEGLIKDIQASYTQEGYILGVIRDYTGRKNSVSVDSANNQTIWFY